MEYQYTMIDSEIGTFTLVRVFSDDDAEIAMGEHFLTHFADEIGDADLTIVYRDEDGHHHWYTHFPLPLTDEELDGQLWTEGEWVVEDEY